MPTLRPSAVPEPEPAGDRVHGVATLEFRPRAGVVSLIDQRPVGTAVVGTYVRCVRHFQLPGGRGTGAESTGGG